MSDYEALIARVRDDYSCTDALHRDLADAVEALLLRSRGDAGELIKADRALKALHAENERLRARRDEWRARARRRLITISRLTDVIEAMYDILRAGERA
jgi:hypothetical protein